MKTPSRIRIIVAVALAAAATIGNAWAEEKTIVGPVTRIELATDGTSALATVKDGKTGDDVTVSITDDLTLDKFKDKRIVEGDDIRVRFDKKDGANSSKSFKKTAGC